MKAITLTQDETTIYDGRNDSARSAMLTDVYGRAQSLADECGETVEIYTDDGIVVEAIRPSCQ